MTVKAATKISRKREPIRELLERNPICAEIVRYLSRHADAVDTAQGIAHWWIHGELRPTQDALLTLLRQRVVRSCVVGTTCVYGYTKNRVLRRRLARYVNSLNDRRAERRP